MSLFKAKTIEKRLKASNMAKLLDRGEEDMALKRTRPMRSFLRQFKGAHKVSGWSYQISGKRY
ncbi:MAG: hypothetical protein ACE5JO_01180 [Candidatus Binatia bacterium]